MKTKIMFAAALPGCLLAFYLGRVSTSEHTVTYSIDQRRTTVHLDWPTYGLPLAEYSTLLSELRQGHSEQALDHMESFLDAAVYDAQCRRPKLRGDALTQLDEALAKTARYREEFPRPLSEGSGFYWTADKQEEIDTFLRTFAK